MYEYNEEWNGIYHNSTLVARVNDNDNASVEYAKDLVASANKSIPMKVVKIIISNQHCPVCGEDVGWNYCGNCGQKLEY